MTLILLLLLQQPPALEAAGSTTVDEGPVLQLTVSRTGKFLVLGRPDILEIFTAADLKPLKTLHRPWTAVSFDEKDEHLLTVGIDLVRIDTAEWRQRSQEELPGREIRSFKNLAAGNPTLVPRQAYIADDGSVYYRTEGGGISRAVRKDGKLVAKRLAGDNSHFKARQIIGAADQTPLVVIAANDGAGIVSNESICYLISSSHSFYAKSVGELTVWVGESYEGLYDSRTWKVKQHRPASGDPEWDAKRDRNDAVVDAKSGWVLVADEKGLRAWNTKEFAQESRYKEFGGPCLKLALDDERRLLYTLDQEQLRRWTLKD